LFIIENFLVVVVDDPFQPTKTKIWFLLTDENQKTHYDVRTKNIIFFSLTIDECVFIKGDVRCIGSYP